LVSGPGTEVGFGAAASIDTTSALRVYNEDRDTAMDLRQKRHDILRLAAHYGARNLRVFGSVARGDDRADSDVDLLVDMDPDRSLLDIVGFGQDLEQLLDRRVEVLTGASLHPALRDRILAESRPL
jgi:predicted nucleotidyltransferase